MTQKTRKQLAEEKMAEFRQKYPFSADAIIEGINAIKELNEATAEEKTNSKTMCDKIVKDMKF